MKKNAFTLAEVLICLTIVGVVAATSIPSVVANVEKNKVGPALAKAIGNLEKANIMALQSRGVRTLSEISTDTSGGNTAYFDNALAIKLNFNDDGLDPILKAEKASKPSNVTYRDYDASVSDILNGASYYQGLDSIDYIRPKENTGLKTDNDNIANLPRAYSGRYYMVYVDVNSMKKGPNMIGKDVFLLYVDDKGTVIPFGSQAYVDYVGETAGKPNYWGKIDGDDTAGQKCMDEKSPVNAKSCAGAIADNRFRVKYKY